MPKIDRMNYYLLSSDTTTFIIILTMTVAVVGLFLLRIAEVWLNMENGKQLGEYFSTKVQKLESRVEDLENRR